MPTTAQRLATLLIARHAPRLRPLVGDPHVNTFGTHVSFPTLAEFTGMCATGVGFAYSAADVSDAYILFCEHFGVDPVAVEQAGQAPIAQYGGQLDR